jgi:hypothetical protein
VTGSSIIRRPLDNNIEVGFEAYNLQGGQYKLMFYRLLGKFCELIWEPHLKDASLKVLSYTNISVNYGDCPIKPGNYAFLDYAPDDIGEYLPPYIPGNERWKLKIYFEENGQRTGGFDVYAILRNTQSMFGSISSGRK